MYQFPTITLVFKGLFLFAFEKDNRFCQAVVMQADKHCLKLTVKAKVTSSENPLELTFAVPDGNIEIVVPDRIVGVDRYEVGAFNRDLAHDKKDFRWALDLEGSDLHNQPLAIKAGSIQRSIFIRNGMFRNQANRRIRIISPSTQVTSTAATQEIGCDIFLEKGEELVFKYGPNNNNFLTFKQEADERDINYEILIDNSCPEEAIADGEPSDFFHYYDVVDVQPNQRFQIAPLQPPPGSQRRPCDPAYLGLTHAHLV